MPSITPTIRDVLHALFGGCDGLLNFRASYTEYTTSAHYRLDDAVAIRAFLNNHALSADCYVSMATYQDDSSATADNALRLPALFADLDFRGSEAVVRQRLNNFLYPPSIVWNSGDGLHCPWLLREPVDLRNGTEVDQAASLLRRLAAHLGADMAAAEPNRVLRVVKTFNHKPHYTPAKRVELEVFERDGGSGRQGPAERAVRRHRQYRTALTAEQTGGVALADVDPGRRDERPCPGRAPARVRAAFPQAPCRAGHEARVYRIVLVPNKTQYQGNRVACIRVEEPGGAAPLAARSRSRGSRQKLFIDALLETTAIRH
jgi:hypothetical protein